ncbi:hypothetical protein D7319_22390 [Streptomyces radicis]|uniref:Transcriptional regulator LacI/GalR-like sensor domain-containing protein n=1 Tax=Streptomyces radicis TaxID=1750517 RepID=A0A3A9W051_9ACTN|nr:hypothetical protein D7319_22390 [Streptomyces radicis]RKN18670.1 hypothetical protein D7318_21250 [Streptomyces radicis]
MPAARPTALARHRSATAARARRRASVRQPVEEIGRTITELLLQEIAHRGTARHHVVLPTSLIVRAST